MATNITWPPIGGASFSIPAAGEVGWPALSNFLIALQNAQSNEAQQIAVRTATTTPINVASASDCVVRVELTVPGPAAVNLPAGVDGQYFVIVDGTGDASTNNITITPDGAETINGQASLVLDGDYAAFALVFKAGNWTIMSSYSTTNTTTIPRADIAAGTPDYVVINDNTGLLSEEQYLSQTRGGFGEDTSGYSGVVKAVAGNFSASSIVDADISASAAIDATKIGAGNVDNTEFGYLNGATSNIQNQINSITGAGITSLTGDVTATGPGAAAATIANLAVTNAKLAADAVDNSKVVAGAAIDVTKLGAGTVDNTEFGYLNGVTSLIQTQLDGKQPLDADLTAIAGLSSNGLIARTSAGNAATRTITGTTNLITVTDGDGVAGNPTITVGSNVVTLTGTQALTNKDYDGGTASNSRRLTVPKDTYANLLTLTRKEGTLLYATDQDILYSDDGTNLNAVGSGTGTGTLNIVDNPSAASSTTGWTAATNYTVSRDTSNSPLAGVIDTCFAISTTTASSESSTSGVYAASQLMPAALRNTKQQVSIYANIPATSLGVWRLSVYNASGTRMSLASDSSSVTTLPGGFNGQFVTTFDADSSASYTVSLTQTTRTSANTLYVTNISIGNGITAQGAAISEWQNVTTPQYVAGPTTSTSTQKWRRVGDTMEVEGYLVSTGAGSAATFVALLPSGYTINSAAMAGTTAAGVNTRGTAMLYDGTNFIAYNTYPFVSGSQNGVRFLANTTSTDLQGTGLASGRQLGYKVAFPISEWAGNGTVNLGQGAQVQLFSSSTGTWDAAAAAGNTVAGYSPITGSLSTGRAKVVRLPYPPQSISDVKLVFLPTGYAAPVGQEGWAPYVGTASVDFGAKITAISGNDVTVTFFQYKAQGSTFNSTTGAVNWSTADTQWAIMVANPSAPVGFGIASAATGAGLISAYAEGTWTPAESALTNLTGTGSYGTATYTRIGNMVFARIESITGYSITSSATATKIVITTTGLPGVTNVTPFYGTALTTRGGAIVTASISDNAGGSTAFQIDWVSNGTGAASIISINFTYTI